MSFKIIIRIKGGLGNQLFCYAAARRLALKTNNELIIDNVTGFKRDFLYNRKYELSGFSIPCRLATRNEMLFPFERGRRAILKLFSNYFFQNNKCYFQEGPDLDLLNLKPNNNIILDGLWQSPVFFEDIEDTLREDLKFNFEFNDNIKELNTLIKKVESVAIHVRWFDQLNNNKGNNLSASYYNNSILRIINSMNNPHFFVFSDDIVSARSILNFHNHKVTYVSDQTKYLNPIYDLYLMSECKNFILANSTFSWWAAWLSNSINNLILIPDTQIKLKNCLTWNSSKKDWIE